MSLIQRFIKGRRVSALAVSTDVPISADEGVNGEDVAIVGPSTTHGYDPETGAIRTMPFHRRTWNPQFFQAQTVNGGNTTPVYTPDRYDVSGFDKIRLFIKTSGNGNIEVLIRVTLDGGYTFTPIGTYLLPDGTKTLLTPIETIGAPLLNIALNNKSGGAQGVDVWGFLY